MTDVRPTDYGHAQYAPIQSSSQSTHANASPANDDYGALLHDHHRDTLQPRTSSAPHPAPDIAKQMMFNIEDLLDTVRRFRDDFSTNGSVSNIGTEPSELFSDIQCHLQQQRRVVPEALSRLLDGVKMLRKLKQRCAYAFSAWPRLDAFMNDVEHGTKAHPDFDGIAAKRVEEARQRAEFIKRQQQLQQQKRQQSPPRQRPQANNEDASYYPPPQSQSNRGSPPSRTQQYRSPSRPHPAPLPSAQERRSVYVYGFPQHWGYKELRYLFDCIGETEDVDVVKRRNDAAFVHYVHVSDAHEAVEQMNNSCPLYCKRPICVEMADKARSGRGCGKSHICWLYNQRTCSYGNECRRKHVCLFCEGPHPRKQCSEVDAHFLKLRNESHSPAPPPHAAAHHHHHNGSNGNGSGSGSNPYQPSELEITVDDIPMNAANENDLRSLFSSCGTITRVKVMKPRNRNMKVRAYMEFGDREALDAALRVDGTIWMGDTISVRQSASNHHYQNNNSHSNGNYGHPQSQYNRDSRPYHHSNNNNNNNNNYQRRAYHNNNNNGNYNAHRDGYNQRGGYNPRYTNNNNNNNNNRNGGYNNNNQSRNRYDNYDSYDGNHSNFDNNHNPNNYSGSGNSTNGESREQQFGSSMNPERLRMVHNSSDSPHRSRSRDRMPPRDRERERSVSMAKKEKSKKDKKPHTIEAGGCITRHHESGSIVIQRKYPLKDVCATFNGVTGCSKRDCDQIHVCSLCEGEDHALLKCHRNGTKIGDVLLKQIETDAAKPGSAMLKIELNVKSKKRSHSDVDSPHKSKEEPPLKKAKTSPSAKPATKSAEKNDDNDDGDPSKAEHSVQKEVRIITELQHVCPHYILFVLDGNVWRRARVVQVEEEDRIKLHYLGWDDKYDEQLCISNTAHQQRLCLCKPLGGFYSEATISPQIKETLHNIKTTHDVQQLAVERVKEYLKLCQLKNEGDDNLLRERLLNVCDEIKVMTADNEQQVLDINMRAIYEQAPSNARLTKFIDAVHEQQQPQSAHTRAETDNALEQNGDYQAQHKKICFGYNSARGCTEPHCRLLHECNQCGSRRHIAVDCPNHNL